MPCDEALIKESFKDGDQVRIEGWLTDGQNNEVAVEKLTLLGQAETKNEQPSSSEEKSDQLRDDDQSDESGLIQCTTKLCNMDYNQCASLVKRRFAVKPEWF